MKRVQGLQLVYAPKILLHDSESVSELYFLTSYSGKPLRLPYGMDSRRLPKYTSKFKKKWSRETRRRFESC